MAWSVVVSGDSSSSRISASLHLVQPGWECRSTGVREAQLEAVVKEAVEGQTGGEASAGGQAGLPSRHDR